MTIVGFVLASLAVSIHPSTSGTTAHPRPGIEAVQDDRRTTEGVVVVDSAALPYVIEGSGRPCIVIGSHVYYPRTFSPAFKAAFRCAYVSHRGFVADAQPPHGGPFTVDTVVEDLETARKSLGLNRFVLVGHSVHGLIALAYAIRYPEHVSHVIAIGALPEISSDFNRRQTEFWDKQASHDRKAAHARNHARLTAERINALKPGEAFIARYVADAARYWAAPSYDATWLWRGVTLNMARVQELFDANRGYHLRTAKSPAQTPVLVALGRHDYSVPYVEWERFRAPFSNLTVELFENSAHTPQLEESSEFDRRVLAWLGRK